jgi:sigma-B regulation protein RsbU (phosphoserine phosphatase)
MALSKTIVQTKARETQHVSDVMEYLNKLVMIEADSGIDLALFYAVLDMKNKTLRYINAGNDSPLLFIKDSESIVKLINENFHLGKIINREFEENEIELNSGDILIFYTDGVINALNEEKEPFGIERLKTILRENYNLKPEEMIQKINQEISSFSKDKFQIDDMTLVVLKVK